MDIITWLIVGLIAGVLATLVMGSSGYGIIGDIIVGIVGAFVGGWIFAKLGVHSPIGGLPARFSWPSSARSCCCSCCD